MAVLLLLAVSSAGAASLGRLAVLSAIGEPLRAEIELSVSAEELETATPRLASSEVYAPAGLQYNTALNGARLAIQYRSNGRRVIDIVTTRPVSEPSIPLLVELEVRGGRIVRAYHVLLGLQNDVPAVVPPSAVLAAVKSAAPVGAKAIAARPSVSRAAVAKPAAAPAAIGDHVAFDRELKRLESQLSASAKTLADMLERVAIMERQVAQLQQDFAAQRAAAAAPQPVSDKPEAKPVADKPAAEKLIVESPAAPSQAPAAVDNAPVAAVTPAPVAIVPVASAPAMQEVQGQNTTRIDAVPRQSHKSNYMLNEALLILAGGALCLLAWLAYWMWGRRTFKTAEESAAPVTES
jgi:pilus assembly protein FimV